MCVIISRCALSQPYSCNLSDVRPIQSLQNHVPTPKFIQPLITISYIEYQTYMISETKCTVCRNMDIKQSKADACMGMWYATHSPFSYPFSQARAATAHMHISVSTYNFNTIHDFCMLNRSLFLTQIIAVKLTQYYHHIACRNTKRTSNHFVYYVCVCVCAKCTQFEMQAAAWYVFLLTWEWDRADCAHFSPYVYNLLYQTLTQHTHISTCTRLGRERGRAASTCDICLILLVVDCIKVLSSDNNSKNKVNFNTGILEHFYGLRKQFVWYKV